jgi:predicted dehydrogenase
MHARIYRSLPVRLVEVDLGDPPPPDLPLRDAIVDVCTPTSVHTESLAWGYTRGARRFVVEKPVAPEVSAWRRQLDAMPAAQVFVVHSYLFSEAFRIACDAMPEARDITITFTKDRRDDDHRGRGAGPDGRLPHLLHIEGPHQAAMALMISPQFRVGHAAFLAYGARGPEQLAPLASAIALLDGSGRRALLATGLHSRPQRRLQLCDGKARQVVAEFSTGPELISEVYERDRGGRVRTLFSGRDDLLRRTLQCGLHSLSTGYVPRGATAGFADSVLTLIDEAVRLAEGPNLAAIPCQATA